MYYWNKYQWEILRGRNTNYRYAKRLSMGTYTKYYCTVSYWETIEYFRCPSTSLDVNVLRYSFIHKEYLAKNAWRHRTQIMTPCENFKRTRVQQRGSIFHFVKGVEQQNGDWTFYFAFSTSVLCTECASADKNSLFNYCAMIYFHEFNHCEAVFFGCDEIHLLEDDDRNGISLNLLLGVFPTNK